MTRTLSLRREALTELSDSDLTGVVGGYEYSNEGITCGIRRCLDFVDLTMLTCHCNSFPGC